MQNRKQRLLNDLNFAVCEVERKYHSCDWDHKEGHVRDSFLLLLRAHNQFRITMLDPAESVCDEDLEKMAGMIMIALAPACSAPEIIETCEGIVAFLATW